MRARCGFCSALALACALLLGDATRALGQDAGSIDIAGGVSFPVQPQQQVGSPPPFPAPGGATIGWTLGVGVFLTPLLSVEGEASSTGVMRFAASGRHDTGVNEQRRDRFVSIGMKGHVPISSVVRVEPVGGIAFMREDASREDLRASSTGAPLVVSSRWFVEPIWTPSIMFGVDLRVGGRRVAVIPGFRMLFATAQPESEVCIVSAPPFPQTPFCETRDAFFDGLYPRWTYRPAVSVGVSF